MGRFKEIHRNNAWLGKWMYRATSNGLHVNLQELHLTKSTWRTIRSISVVEWAKWAESVRLDDQYNDNLEAFQKFVLNSDND